MPRPTVLLLNTLLAAGDIARCTVDGNGVASFYSIDPMYIHQNSEVHNDKNTYFTHGVLELTLHTGRYEWRYLPLADAGEPIFNDSGQASCP